jgi:hypothetical protein
LHKQIVMSATYRQSAAHDAAKLKADPQNKLHWRRTPARLEAEVIRDSILKVSGRLDERMFGAGTLDERMLRRSIYFMIKRSKLIPSMQLFDSPEPLVSQGSRPVTIIAPQALHFMNNGQVRASAMELARQLKAQPDTAAAVTLGYQTVLGRAPTPKEQKSIASFIDVQEKSYTNNGRELALADFVQVLFGLNEFIVQ